VILPSATVKLRSSTTTTPPYRTVIFNPEGIVGPSEPSWIPAVRRLLAGLISAGGVVFFRLGNLFNVSGGDRPGWVGIPLARAGSGAQALDDVLRSCRASSSRTAACAPCTPS
jgi:hypothetical protein